MARTVDRFGKSEFQGTEVGSLSLKVVIDRRDRHSRVDGLAIRAEREVEVLGMENLQGVVGQVGRVESLEHVIIDF